MCIHWPSGLSGLSYSPCALSVDKLLHYGGWRNSCTNLDEVFTVAQDTLHPPSWGPSIIHRLRIKGLDFSWFPGTSTKAHKARTTMSRNLGSWFPGAGSQSSSIQGNRAQEAEHAAKRQGSKTGGQAGSCALKVLTSRRLKVL